MDNITTVASSNTAISVTEVVNDEKNDNTITDTERVVIITMLSLLAVVGTFGNALAIYVFANLKQKVTSTIFILTLAGTDFITCLITMPFTIAMESLNYYVPVDPVCKVYHFLITTTVPFSCVVIVAIAVDRYMCICHPFHHWMTIPRARVIIGALAFVIFIFGGIVCMHYTIYSTHTVNESDLFDLPLNTTSLISPGGINQSDPYEYYFTTHPFTTGFTQSQELNGTTENQSNEYTTSSFNNITKTVTITELGVCDVNPEFINKRFFIVFRHMYSGIFLASCVVVLVLYSIIYRSVIAQRRKKLKIRSAQCCLLWNAASIDSTHEAVEMTQDFELSQFNGEERYMPRQISSTVDESEPQNNGLFRKGSLSKARIERMRLANIKTAFTLFIVTLVFIFAFLPSWLMALGVVKMNVIIFYMHYMYNVVNPLIYAFLNQNFKTELRRIFRCQNH